ncbi:MAG: Uma2 family endonuclease [Blastocatellia bacterium]|nr:Uma2 family endonuclease [Blastocatellia bacterium]
MSATTDLLTVPQPVTLDFNPVLRKINDDDFFEFCLANRDLRIERTKEGELIVMPPTGGETGGSNFELTGVFRNWVKSDGTGKGFDSSTAFMLPNGAIRSPDLSWVKFERWNDLTSEDRKKFPPICPDFVIELRSPTDSIIVLKEKMEEYIENGAQLGWLIDPLAKKVYIYRPQLQVEVLENPTRVSGDPLLKGFALEMKEIWD